MNLQAEGPFADLLKSKKVVITIGSGGVGKTTSSIAIAGIAAMQGKKVALLSIDPAKRLADAMGIKIGSDLVPVDFGPIKLQGTISAAMLDQKSVFDAMVKRWSPEKIQPKIFANQIYQAVSTNLSGPLEYMALAKLQSIYESGDYDMIVLDTPPDTHALDFLNRPNILSGFLEKGVMTWLIKPFYLAQKLGAGKLLSIGSRAMAGISSVTGVKMLQMLAEFLVQMEDVIKGFAETGQQVSKLIRKPETVFILITAPHNAALRSAKSLVNELATMGLPLGAAVINRCSPAEISQKIKEARLIEGLPEVLTTALAAIERKDLAWQGNIEDFIDDIEQTVKPFPVIVKVEEREAMVHTLEDLIQFSMALVSPNTQVKG